jgi:TPR repeat protein
MNGGLPHCRRSGLYCRTGRHRQLEPDDPADCAGQRSRQAGVEQSVQQFRFAGLGLYPGRNLLNGSAGNTIDLTTSEARLLTHFVSRPWALCTRSEIGELLYGPEHSVGDRAIDVVVRAAEWYRQATEQGVATAQLRLGFLYLSDEGVVREPEAGMAWLRRAVELGDPEAQTALGMLYARGESC